MYAFLYTRENLAQKISHNVPAVYDVFAVAIKETGGFQQPQKCGGEKPHKGRRPTAVFRSPRALLRPKHIQTCYMQYPRTPLFYILIFFMYPFIPLGLNTPPLGAVRTGGAGDLFPRIRKDFKGKSSIPRRLRRGFLFFLAKLTALPRTTYVENGFERGEGLERDESGGGGDRACCFYLRKSIFWAPHYVAEMPKHV
jgi:hypothetical protein